MQWPAVRKSVGEMSEPLQRHSGTPSSSWATISPTYGWFVPSGTPFVIAVAAAAPNSVTASAATSATTRVFILIGFSPLVA